MEFGTNKSLIAIRPDDGSDINAAATSLQGWTDVSEGARGVCQVNYTGGGNVRLTPHGQRRMGRVIAGDRAGTYSLTCVVSEAEGNGTREARKICENAWLSGTKRIQVLIQEDRAALTNNAGVTTPAASATNEQHIGSVVLTGVDLWGPGGLATAILNVTGDLDSDFKRYPA